MSFNLAVILTESAATAPGRTACFSPGGQLTYAELDTLSDTLAAALTDKGLRPGDMVALQLPNVPQFLIAYFGILKAGGVAVPLNVMLKAGELEYHLADCGARTLITWAGTLAEAAKGAAAAGVRDLYVAGPLPVTAGSGSGAAGPQPGAAGAASFDELLATPAAGYAMVPREPTDTAVVVYTSGTTGRPKGAELTHFQLYMNADVPARAVGVLPTDVVLTALPLFHVFGLSSILDVCVRLGCAMSLIPRWDTRAVLAAIERDRCTFFDGVPTMFAELMGCPDLGHYDLSSLRLAVSGGASLPGPLLDAFEQRFGVPVLEGYGLTETASTVTQTLPAWRRHYSVGKPVWGTQTQVWDASGRPLPPGQENVGEIVTRGYHVMKGYLNAPEATAAAITDGWLHTGDMGYFDADGSLFLVSRSKDIIIRGGYNVYPSEIENVLRAHPDIADAAVVGVTDDRLGEEVLAAVVIRTGCSLRAADLIAYCRGQMAAYKYPRIIDFRAELPRNHLGKVLKDELTASWSRACGAARPARSLP